MLVRLEEEVGQLVKLAKNLKKSVNTVYKQETLKIKLRYAEDLFSDIEADLLRYEAEIPSSNRQFLFTASREAIIIIRNELGNKLENLQKSAAKMALAPAPFDIKTATALVQPYDGASVGLEAFVDSVNLLAELIPPAHIATAIKFIKTRLSGKARFALPAEPLTIGEIIDAVSRTCKSKETPEIVLAKLKTTSNKGDQQKFCDEVETLSQKLATVYVSDQIPLAVASKMATKAGVDALINGVQNSALKIILRAGSFSTVNDAIQKIIENSDTTNTPAAQVLTAGRTGVGRRRDNNYRGRRNDNIPRNQPNRGNYVPNRNYLNNNRGYPNNWGYRGNGYRGNFQRGNWTQRGRLTNMFLAQQNGMLYQPFSQQEIQQPVMLQPNQAQQQQQFQQSNIHPLGATPGQHIQ